MNPDLMKVAVLSIPLAFGVGCSTIRSNGDGNGIAGKFRSEDGSVLTIARGESENEYRISAEDAGSYFWTSVGFYRPDCRCIDSVFQYDSHEDDYGDAVGMHRFSFHEDNDRLVKLGGWKELTEFPEREYTRR